MGRVLLAPERLVAARRLAYRAAMSSGLRRLFGSVLVLLSTGCMADVGSNMKVPSDAANTCRGHCSVVGMELAAMAIMANNVGCICQYARDRQAPGHPEAAAAGMATIALQQHAEQSRQHAKRPPPISR